MDDNVTRYNTCLLSIFRYFLDRPYGVLDILNFLASGLFSNNRDIGLNISLGSLAVTFAFLHDLIFFLLRNTSMVDTSFR